MCDPRLRMERVNLFLEPVAMKCQTTLQILISNSSIRRVMHFAIAGAAKAASAKKMPKRTRKGARK